MNRIKKWILISIGIPVLAVYFNIPTYIRTGFLMQSSKNILKFNLSLGLDEFNVEKACRLSYVILEILLVYRMSRSILASILYLLILYILKSILFTILILIIADMVADDTNSLDVCMFSAAIVMFISTLSVIYKYI